MSNILSSKVKSLIVLNIVNFKQMLDCKEVPIWFNAIYDADVKADTLAFIFILTDPV